MQPFLVFFGYFSLAVALSVLRGSILKVLWGWFVVPLGVVQIGIATAIGISVIVSLLVDTRAPVTKVEHTEQLTYSVALPIVGLVVGWIAHFFL